MSEAATDLAPALAQLARGGTMRDFAVEHDITIAGIDDLLAVLRRGE